MQYNNSIFFLTAPSLKNMINFVIGKQNACIFMGPVSAIKVCNKALVDFAAELDFAANHQPRPFLEE